LLLQRFGKHENPTLSLEVKKAAQLAKNPLVDKLWIAVLGW
jgi:hypothetical protein